jgi:rhomboid family GlyGly-CTERM serine protease
MLNTEHERGSVMNASLSIPSTAGRRLPGVSLLLVAFALLASLLPGVADWLQYDRLAVSQGAFWRLLTSHFVHWSTDHLFWDVLVFGAVGWLCERDDRTSYLACVGLSALAISGSLAITLPQMQTYRGLSGIDSALFAMLAVRMGQRELADRNWIGLSLVCAVAVGFVAKLVFELATGGTLFVDSPAAGMVPVPLAHVVGGLVGVICAVYCDPTAWKTR